MDSTFYTQHGILNTQVRVFKRLTTIANQKGIRLDPGWPTWFDGSWSLPKPGDTWKLTLSSRGVTSSTTLTAEELAAFIAGRWSEVPAKLDRALDALSAPNKTAAPSRWGDHSV
jgi:hypothetical protein